MNQTPWDFFMRIASDPGRSAYAEAILQEVLRLRTVKGLTEAEFAPIRIYLRSDGDQLKQENDRLNRQLLETGYLKLTTQPERTSDDIYFVSEPEMVGRISTRTELTVLPANDHSPRELGWAVSECVVGCEIETVPMDGTEAETITGYDDLKDGQMVRAFGIVFKVERDENSVVGWSPNREVMYILEHGKDSRQCWACTGIANLTSLR